MQPVEVLTEANTRSWHDKCLIVRTSEFALSTEFAPIDGNRLQREAPIKGHLCKSFSTGVGVDGGER